jgi:acetyl esterase/lipase
MRYLPFPRAKLPTGINVQEYSIDGLTSVVVRVIAPIEKAVSHPAILWLHGGGFVMGSAKQDDRTCARLVDLLQAVVISVDYRLAPEHPYPAALEDCYAAYKYLHSAATSLHIDPSRVAVVGQSAGGGLAASLIQMIRDRGDRMPVLQMLIYPMLDDRTVLKPVNDALYRLWDSSSNRFGWASYLAIAPGSVDVPEYAVPMRRKDLSKLAPAWIGVGTHDLFLDEDVKYAQRLERAGVEVHLEIIEGAFHGFDLASPNALISKRFFELQVAAIAQAFRTF